MKEKVAVVKCDDYSLKSVEASLDKIFSYFGGLERLVFPGNNVLLKPNLIAAHVPADGVTTHPIVLEALIRKVYDCQASPVIADSPAFGSANGVAQTAGIRSIAERYNVPIIELLSNADISRGSDFNDSLLSRIPKKAQKKVRKLSTVSRSILNYDKIINVPKLKAHVQVHFTGATKNLYGCISGKAKAFRHFSVRNDIELFALIILSLYQRVRPEFTIVDAVEVMEKRGPRGGLVTFRGVLIGGINCLSIDAVIANLLSLNVEDVALLRTAKKFGIEGVHHSNIEALFEGVDSSALHNFILPEEICQISFSAKTVIKSFVKQLLLLLREKKQNPAEQYL